MLMEHSFTKRRPDSYREESSEMCVRWDYPSLDINFIYFTVLRLIII